MLEQHLPTFRYYFYICSKDQSFKFLLQIKQRIHRGLKSALVRVKKKIGSLKSQYVDDSEQVALRHKADLLLAHIHLIKPNQETVEVIDWETGTPCLIDVDPTKTPSEMINAMYTKAKKQKRAIDQLVPLIEQAEQDQNYLQDVAVLLEQLVGSYEDFEAVREIERELVNEKFLKPLQDGLQEKKSKTKGQKSQKGQDGSSKGVSQSFRTYLSPGGFQVLVGRNSSQNDLLSTRIAQKNDLWMHARGVPGAHVLLRIPAGSTAAEEDIQFAADLAAFFSKARLEKKTDVTYASPLFIEKPKGAKPGQVIVKQESVTVGVADRSAAAQLQDE